MRCLDSIRESPNYPRLKESVEYRYCKTRFWTVGLLSLTCILVSLIPRTGIGNGGSRGILFLLGIVLFFVFLGYGCWPMVEMFLHISDYIFMEVTLQDIHSVGKYGHYYTVEFKDRQGNSLRRNTSCMFRDLFQPTLEEYNGQRVLIGYNSKTDRVAVIKKVS